MPESPEVEALAGFLDERLGGREIADVDLLEFRALKTRARPLSTLTGARVVGVRRIGKHLDLELDRAHLVVSLGRHGWARWHDDDDIVEPVLPPALAAITFEGGGTLELTDAGSWVSLGLSVVDDPWQVPSIAKLGPDPADPGFTRAEFDAAVVGRRKQIKAILQEQESLAGIGNAYSDEILHTARISPVAHGAALDGTALDRLFAATTGTVRDAIAARCGIPIGELKAAKVAAMRVHGRGGQACPVCGDTVRDLRFASTTAQYCPTCQTGGVPLPA